MENIDKSPKTKLNIEEEFQILQNKYAVLEQNCAELIAKLNWYEEQFRLSQQKRFGASSEQTNPDQLSIFNEAEKESRPEKEEPAIEEITYKRKRKVLIKNHLMIFQWKQLNIN